MAEKLVWRDSQGYINVKHPDIPSYVYDFQINESTPLPFWERQLSEKLWVTPEHLKQLRAVAGGA